MGYDDTHEPSARCVLPPAMPDAESSTTAASAKSYLTLSERLAALLADEAATAFEQGDRHRFDEALRGLVVLVNEGRQARR